MCLIIILLISYILPLVLNKNIAPSDAPTKTTGPEYNLEFSL
jgi:hypothetical protein